MALPTGCAPTRCASRGRVPLDKDQRTAGWKPPSYQAHIPTRPTEAEYQALVEEFWWVTTYVAKSLWRDELVFASQMGSGPGSQARSDAAHARMAHRDRAELVDKAGGVMEAEQ